MVAGKKVLVNIFFFLVLFQIYEGRAGERSFREEELPGRELDASRARKG